MDPTHGGDLAGTTGSVGPGGSGDQSSGPVGTGGSPTFSDIAGQNSKAAMLDVVEKWAYNNKRLQLIDVPAQQLQKDQLAQQAAQFARMAAMQDKRFDEIDKPMSDANRQLIMQQIASDATKTALAVKNEDLTEQVQHAQVALQASQQAESQAEARRQFAMNALSGVDQQAIQRQQQGMTGLTSAAGLEQSGDRMSLDAASKSADLGLQAAQLEAGLRGPRNAFQEMALQEGLNGQGVARGIDALAGRFVLPSVQGDQMAPQAATLQTLAEDTRSAGNGPSGPTPYDILDRIAARAGTTSSTLQSLIQASQGQLANPYTDNAHALERAAGETLNNQNGSPGQNIEFGIAGTNAPFTAPGNPAQQANGSGQKVVTAWQALLKSNQDNGLPPPSDQDAVNMLMSAFGLDAAGARELHNDNKDWFVRGVGTPDPARMEVEAQRIAAERGLGNTTSPVGRGQAATDNYQDTLRTTGQTSLGQDDPRLIDIYKQTYGVGDAEARQMAKAAADYYKANGSPMSPGQSGLNASHFGGNGPTPTSGAPDPRGTGSRLRTEYDAALQRYNVPYISADDPRMADIYQRVTRISPEGAQWMAQTAADYYKQHGQAIPDAMQESNLRAAQGIYGQEQPASAWASPTGQSGAAQGGPYGPPNAPTPGFRAPIGSLGSDIHSQLDQEWQQAAPGQSDDPYGGS